MKGDLALLKQVRFVVFDFDGVFTDNRVLVQEDGTEYVFCSRADGLGLQALGKVGIRSIIISTESNPVVKSRAEKLKMECVHGCPDKGVELQRQLSARGYAPHEVAYVGNDVNDRDCLLYVGVPICVSDAHPDVKPLARLTTTLRGGHGAVREVCDFLIQARPHG